MKYIANWQIVIQTPPIASTSMFRVSPVGGGHILAAAQNSLTGGGVALRSQLGLQWAAMRSLQGSSMGGYAIILWFWQAGGIHAICLWWAAMRSLQGWSSSHATVLMLRRPGGGHVITTRVVAGFRWRRQPSDHFRVFTNLEVEPCQSLLPSAEEHRLPTPMPDMGSDEECSDGNIQNYRFIYAPGQPSVYCAPVQLCTTSVHKPG